MTADSGNSVGTTVRLTSPAKSREARTWETWFAAVDVAVQKQTHGLLCRDDLPDYLYRDRFEEGATPSQVAREAVQAAKDEFGGEYA